MTPASLIPGTWMPARRRRLRRPMRWYPAPARRGLLPVPGLEQIDVAGGGDVFAGLPDIAVAVPVPMPGLPQQLLAGDRRCRDRLLHWRRHRRERQCGGGVALARAPGEQGHAEHSRNEQAPGHLASAPASSKSWLT